MEQSKNDRAISMTVAIESIRYLALKLSKTDEAAVTEEKGKGKDKKKGKDGKDKKKDDKKKARRAPTACLVQSGRARDAHPSRAG